MEAKEGEGSKGREGGEGVREKEAGEGGGGGHRLVERGESTWSFPRGRFLHLSETTAAVISETATTTVRTRAHSHIRTQTLALTL
jgi:hypothetical protein